MTVNAIDTGAGRGHLFAASQCDLSRLACDAIVLSCDAALNITRGWSTLLPDGLPTGDSPGWLRLPESHSDGHVVTLPDRDGRRIRASVTVDRGIGVAEPVDRLVEGIRSAASRPIRKGRAGPATRRCPTRSVLAPVDCMVGGVRSSAPCSRPCVASPNLRVSMLRSCFTNAAISPQFKLADSRVTGPRCRQHWWRALIGWAAWRRPASCHSSSVQGSPGPLGCPTGGIF